MSEIFYMPMLPSSVPFPYPTARTQHDRTCHTITHTFPSTVLLQRFPVQKCSTGDPALHQETRRSAHTIPVTLRFFSTTTPNQFPEKSRYITGRKTDIPIYNFSYSIWQWAVGFWYACDPLTIKTIFCYCIIAQLAKPYFFKKASPSPLIFSSQFVVYSNSSVMP